jgi:imidazolonepropionase-like amidohydrolase
MRFGVRSRRAGWLSLLGLVAGCRAKGGAAPDVLIEHVTVIDATGGPVLRDVSVSIQGEEIVSVGPAVKVPAGPQTVRINGKGKYLIPGLWDMHVHLIGYEEHAFPLFLANGVTTIRDLSGNLARSLWLRQETRYKRILGPEMLIAGPTLDSPFLVRAVAGTPYAQARESVPDSARAVFWVDSLARVGIDQIKVHSMTPRTAFFAIVKEAREKGIPVAGHIPDSLMPKEAIEAGLRTLEHGSRLEYQTSARGAEIDRWQLAATAKVVAAAGAKPSFGPVVRIRFAATDSALASFDPARAAEFAKWAAARDVWFDPTLVVLEAFHRVNEREIREPPELKYAPESTRLDEGLPPKPSPTAADIAAGRRRYETALAPTRALIRAGAKFVTGTDVPVNPLVPGFSLHRELALLVAAGMTPLQAIQAATRNAADAAGKAGQVGTIEAGKRADLVLLDADPTAAIANTTRIRAVISRGRVLDRSTLDRMLADAEAFARQR